MNSLVEAIKRLPPPWPVVIATVFGVWWVGGVVAGFVALWRHMP